MKSLFNSFYIIVSFIIISCSGNAKNEPDDKSDSTAASITQTTSGNDVAIKKYRIKSGIITFDQDLMGIKQKSVLYFDDYGMKETEEKYDGEVIKETNLCDGKNRYLLMHNQKTAYTSGTCFRGVAYKFDWDEISKADKEYKVSKMDNIDVAGKDCESYSMSSSDYPTVFAGWNNICLYMNTKSKFGNVITKAVKVEENIDVPAEKFQVPAGYEIKKGL